MVLIGMEQLQQELMESLQPATRGLVGRVEIERIDQSDPEKANWSAYFPVKGRSLPDNIKGELERLKVAFARKYRLEDSVS